MLALLFSGLTVVACLCMSAIFAFPQAPFNPFPPEADSLLTEEVQATATDINLATGTGIPTLGQLPSEQTATPADGRPSATPDTPSAPGATTPAPGASPTVASPPTATLTPPIDLPTATATSAGYPSDPSATPATPYP